MEQMGWIQLHRKFIDWEWYDDINTKVLFIHCLLKANHIDKKWRGVDINRGEFLTSYSTLSIETGLSVQKVRTSISNLESTGEVTRQSTSKLTKLTICKYDTYNNLKSSTNKQGNTQITNEQQTNNKPITTTKNDNNKKNEKNEKNKELESDFDIFWSDYPRKVSKGKAKSAYKNARKKTSHDEIMRGMFLSAALKNEDPQYIPHASTWLNGECWADKQEEIKTTIGAGKVWTTD